VAAELGIDLVTHVIGPGRPHDDLYGDWARVREVAESGCVLVRPDVHVAWRAAELVQEPSAELRRVMDELLARPH
jgi:2,4-dichlorophenol 6-monooxygenase